MKTKDLLKLIENVDPKDSASLDKIDAETYGFINKLIFTGFESDKEPIGDFGDGLEYGDFKYSTYKTLDGKSSWSQHPEYTRSRDALKAIRPDGWFFEMVSGSWKAEARPKEEPRYWYQAFLPSKARVRLPKNNKTMSEKGVSDGMPTEELAELHVIIQIIEWERNQ